MPRLILPACVAVHSASEEITASRIHIDICVSGSLETDKRGRHALR
jgi:hypothetical protein